MPVKSLVPSEDDCAAALEVYPDQPAASYDGRPTHACTHADEQAELDTLVLYCTNGPGLKIDALGRERSASLSDNECAINQHAVASTLPSPRQRPRVLRPGSSAATSRHGEKEYCGESKH